MIERRIRTTMREDMVLSKEKNQLFSNIYVCVHTNTYTHSPRGNRHISDHHSQINETTLIKCSNV